MITGYNPEKSGKAKTDFLLALDGIKMMLKIHSINPKNQGIIQLLCCKVLIETALSCTVVSLMFEDIKFLGFTTSDCFIVF